MGNTTHAATNFGFLAEHDPLLLRLTQQAERYFAEDPNTCLFKLRQFAEYLLPLLAARTGAKVRPDMSFHDTLQLLRRNRALHDQAHQAFNTLRKAGNKAAHEMAGDHSEALQMLKVARALAVYFHQTVKDRGFAPAPFLPPPDPKRQAAEVAAELAELRAEVARVLQAKAEAEAVAREEAQRRAEAEASVLLAAQEKALAESRAEETAELLAQEQARHVQVVEELATQAAEAPVEELEKIKAQANSINLDLDEAATRRLIDQQLRDAGWEVDSQKLTWKKGVRPQKGKSLAVAEWPTDHPDGGKGWADYVLFLGLTPVAVVEAKRANKNVASAIGQAKRYSEGFRLEGDLVGAGGPWEKYRIPFLYSTNGRPYLLQLQEFSGIHFLDARKPTNHSRALPAWHAPEGLQAMLAQDIDQATAALKQESLDYLGLRYYQNHAILAVEGALAEGNREILLAMATGTGKTRTAIGLLYRLLKTRRFNRILFLVDRTSLGEQAHNAFKDVTMENLQKFSDIYEVKGLGDLVPDPTTRVHLATVQAMVKRCLYAEDDVLTPDKYDCIIVDECHRGYNLDREMSEAELEFRSEEDYISMYRRVLDHFDAVRIGLTATPALHTTQIFGTPVYQYGYRQAVIDGFLVDHEPPVQIVTGLAEDGISWQAGEPVEVYDVKRQNIDLVHMDDEVKIEVEGFNKRVVTENFNKAVLGELARHIDPDLDGKTLIFCATDHHADMVVRLLKAELDQSCGPINDNAIRKITGAADKPSELIRRFKNEKYPSVAVTVDLLTTGIDVPEIVNLVFLRRVRSRILYDQMVGRATRLCPDIDKKVFYIFDAVGLYAAMQDYTEMKPVVTQQHISFEQLVREITEVPDPLARQEFLEQLIAKLQRKRFDDEGRQQFETLTQMTVAEVLDFFRKNEADTVAGWFTQHPTLVNLLDSSTGGGARLLVSNHDDEVRRVERGYGHNNRRPGDYLEEFSDFLKSNLNAIPALTVVTQRPRNLTRAQLKELEQALAQEGYILSHLESAWRETTNQDIAASIIGFIRQRALGSPLLPYGERVDRALKKILAKQDWTKPQRQWLERIAKQMKLETIVDRDTLDQGQFKDKGGFNRLNKVFGGQMEQLLGDLVDAAWEDDAA
ncbi:MAG: type I restriction-modification system endonuclease [Vulcanimicrobiota bacterium]